MAGLGGIVGGFGGSAIGGATVTLLLDDAQFKSALAEDEAKFKSSTTSMGAASARAGSVAKAGFNTLALGAGIAVAAGVSMATTFEKTFAQIGSLAGKLGLPMDQAKAHVLALAKATGQDPNGLAQALYFAASAGLQASQVMPVLDASAKGAAIGMGDAQTVAQTLTSVLNAYKGTGLDAGTAMNIMTAAVKNGKAEMSDFATGLGPIISVAASAGVSFNDLAAGIAEATNQGVPFARAVTGFRFLISALTAPTAKATSALKSIGLTTDQVAKMITQPGGLERAIQLIHDRTAAMGSAGREAWSAITGGARGSIVAIDLAGKHTADTNRIVQDLGRSAQASATDFHDAYSKISNTDAVKFQRALADVKVALIQVGEKVLPSLAPLVTILGAVLEKVVPLAPAILGVWAAFKTASGIAALINGVSAALAADAAAADAAAVSTANLGTASAGAATGLTAEAGAADAAAASAGAFSVSTGGVALAMVGVLGAIEDVNLAVDLFTGKTSNAVKVIDGGLAGAFGKFNGGIKSVQFSIAELNSGKVPMFADPALFKQTQQFNALVNGLTSSYKANAGSASTAAGATSKAGAAAKSAAGGFNSTAGALDHTASSAKGAAGGFNATAGALDHTASSAASAKGQIQGVVSGLAQLHDKTVNVNVNIHYNVSGSGPPGGKPLP